MEPIAIKPVLEAAIMAAEAPVPLERLLGLFSLLDEGAPSAADLEAAIAELQQDYAGHGVELASVAGGYRFQTRAEYADWVNRLWEERKPRYSRALLETIAIIAYRQPITRSEIEDIRGVAVSTGIMKTLQDRDWVKVVGHRDVPGRPAIYATTRQFLEYFNLHSLDALPTLAELRDIDGLNPDLFAETGVEYPPGLAPETAEEEGRAATSDAYDKTSEEAEGDAESFASTPTVADDAPSEPVQLSGSGAESHEDVAHTDEIDIDSDGDDDDGDDDDEDDDDGDDDDGDDDDGDDDDGDDDDGDDDDEDDDDEDDDDEDDDDEDDDDEDDDDEDDDDEDDDDEDSRPS